MFPPKDIQVLISGICAGYFVQQKNDFVDVLKWVIL